MKNANGRISVKNRQALSIPVKEFAKTQNLEMNYVMSAVLFAGERMEQRMSPKALLGLVNQTTMNQYAQEISRREQAREIQSTGLIWNMLPKGLRTEEAVIALRQRVPVNASIPAIKTWITSQVQAMELNFGPA